jgi:hypothetical protein
MADKITLTDLVNLQNETTAVNAINANNGVLTTALDNTLSRDGTAPNQMGANLDMNGFQILNQGNISFTVSTLPTAVIGKFAVVTDGTVGLAWGAGVTGGSTTTYLVWYNGTSWTVLGK